MGLTKVALLSLLLLFCQDCTTAHRFYAIAQETSLEPTPAPELQEPKPLQLVGEPALVRTVSAKMFEPPVVDEDGRMLLIAEDPRIEPGLASRFVVQGEYRYVVYQRLGTFELPSTLKPYKTLEGNSYFLVKGEPGDQFAFQVEPKDDGFPIFFKVVFPDEDGSDPDDPDQPFPPGDYKTLADVVKGALPKLDRATAQRLIAAYDAADKEYASFDDAKTAWKAAFRNLAKDPSRDWYGIYLNPINQVMGTLGIENKEQYVAAMRTILKALKDNLNASASVTKTVPLPTPSQTALPPNVYIGSDGRVYYGSR